MKDEIYKMLKYSLIGVLNTFIHWVVFFVLYQAEFKQYMCNFSAIYCLVRHKSWLRMVIKSIYV